jgi:hypothetical protein
MIINHQYKFIFIKTRKTAGTSIEFGLSKFCGDKDVITEIVSESDETKAEFGYVSERNYKIPLKRAKAIDLVKIPRRGWPKFTEHSAAGDVKERIDPEIWKSYFKFTFERNPFDRFISQYYWSTRHRKIDMHDYIRTIESYRLSNWPLYTIRDYLAVDFVGKFENLKDDLEHIRDRLKLPTPIELPQTKTGYKPEKLHYSQIIDDVIRDHLELVCAKELIKFGYEFEHV